MSTSPWASPPPLPPETKAPTPPFRIEIFPTDYDRLIAHIRDFHTVISTPVPDDGSVGVELPEGMLMCTAEDIVDLVRPSAEVAQGYIRLLNHPQADFREMKVTSLFASLEQKNVMSLITEVTAWAIILHPLFKKEVK